MTTDNYLTTPTPNCLCHGFEQGDQQKALPTTHSPRRHFAPSARGDFVVLFSLRVMFLMGGYPLQQQKLMKGLDTPTSEELEKLSNLLDEPEKADLWKAWMNQEPGIQSGAV